MGWSDPVMVPSDGIDALRPPDGSVVAGPTPMRTSPVVFPVLRPQMQDARLRARAHTRRHGEDIREVAEWPWEGPATGRVQVDDRGGLDL